jgi:hypothetical protein
VIPAGPDPANLPNHSDMPAVLPGPLWARHFKPGLRRPIMPPEGPALSQSTGQSFLSLTSTATVTQQAAGSSHLLLTATGAGASVVTAGGASHLLLTSTGAAGIAGAGASHLKLTSAGAAENVGGGGSRLLLTSASTPVLLVKTLIVSIASQAGTDAYGNAYVQGLGVYGFGELVSPVIVVNSNAGGFFVEAS